VCPGTGGAYPPDQPKNANYELEARIVEVLHRLRTPLTIAKGWAEMAERQAQPGTAATQLLPHLHQIIEAIRGMETEINVLAAEANARLADPNWGASQTDTGKSDRTGPESRTSGPPSSE